MPQFSIETSGELHPGISQEWMLTNGLGSFSSGTIVGCNTRRYHALLMASTLPPVGRMVMLNTLGQILTIDREVHEFWINQFRADNFHPRGERYLRRFHLGNDAVWEYDVAGVKVVKRMMLQWKQDTIRIQYEIDPAGRSIELQLLPLVSIRDFHSLLRESDRKYDVRAERNQVAISSEGHTLHLHCDAGEWHGGPDWWKDFFYAVEQERGQDHREDLFMPGRFVIKSDSEISVTVTASTQAHPVVTQPVQTLPTAKSRTMRTLTRAASDFIVDRKCPDGSPSVTILAGYPWFADWGRDTMIALPGLLLVPGRYKDAGQVLSLFANYVSDGMIPNRFDDYTNHPHYNTVDASLWFIHAAHEYLRLSGDRRIFETTLLPACRAIIDGYTRGTRFNIHMDSSDGLLTQGDATTQLTWMDAKCGDVAFTPRQGKAVEINALWHSALMLMGMEDRARLVRENFSKCFWISPFLGLADVVDGERRDQSIRPNQIFAVSLPHSPLEHEQQHAVVEVVRRELLTPFGLRTLAFGDPNFHARYTGPQFQRDRAYHNGTIWPWLIGPFLEAYLKVHDRSEESIAQARTWLQPLIDSMEKIGCIGQIAEIFEAQPPHRPAGCFAQAWSVAEVLRLAALLEM